MPATFLAAFTCDDRLALMITLSNNLDCVVHSETVRQGNPRNLMFSHTSFMLNFEIADILADVVQLSHRHRGSEEPVLP